MPKSHSIKAPSRASLETFIAKVLEPVTEAELTDYEYNRLAREARKTTWDTAERKAEYYEAFRNAALRVESGKNKGQHFKFGELVPTWGELTELHRAAFAEQLVTPAAHKLAIDWKKAQSKLLGYVRGLVTPEQLATSIADDEDFLARHPIRRERAAQ